MGFDHLPHQPKAFLAIDGFDIVRKFDQAFRQLIADLLARPLLVSVAGLLQKLLILPRPLAAMVRELSAMCCRMPFAKKTKSGLNLKTPFVPAGGLSLRPCQLASGSADFL
jgi:hypothetical protein